MGLVCSSATFAVWTPGGGLETRQFTFFIVVAVVCLSLYRESRYALLAVSLSLAAAALTRPEGPLFAVCCFAWYAVQRRGDTGRGGGGGGDWRAAACLAVPFVVLVAGHYLFRYSYYGEWLPEIGGGRRWRWGSWSRRWVRGSSRTSRRSDTSWCWREPLDIPVARTYVAPQHRCAAACPAETTNTETSVMSKKTEQPLKQATELYATVLDQTIRANRIVAKGIERTIEEQLGLFEATIESTRPLAAAKRPDDVLAAQMDAWKTLNEKLVATTGKLAEIQRETGAELKDVVVDSLKAVNETMPKAA